MAIQSNYSTSAIVHIWGLSFDLWRLHLKRRRPPWGSGRRRCLINHLLGKDVFW